MATQLTEHFSLEELCASGTAKKHGLDNTPTDEIAEHLRLLAEQILEPMRQAWGSGINVNSGYRSPEVNGAVGGSKTSAHCFGWAADLSPSNRKMPEFKAFVQRWLRENDIAFDEYINELSGVSQWVHIALYNLKGEQRRKYLVYKNGTYSKL
jgi:putative chitinase